MVTMRNDDVGQRLLSVPASVHLHAILSWDARRRLDVIAFVTVPAPIDGFKMFFTQEVALHAEASASGPSFVPGLDDSPNCILSAAEAANQMSPPMWKVRKVITN